MEKNIENYINEFLANNGRQALSDDMAEQVVGGINGLFLNGKWVPEEQVYNLFLNMTDIFGYNIAANVFCEASGFSKTEIAKHYGGGTDMERMYALITQCFTTFAKIENGGKTF